MNLKKRKYSQWMVQRLIFPIIWIILKNISITEWISPVIRLFQFIWYGWSFKEVNNQSKFTEPNFWRKHNFSSISYHYIVNHFDVVFSLLEITKLSHFKSFLLFQSVLPLTQHSIMKIKTMRWPILNFHHVIQQKELVLWLNLMEL